ncbi:MAG: hypothetical protein JSV00_01165, partial [bacterium]
MRLSVPFLIALLLSTVTVRTSVAAEASLVEYSGEKIVRVELEGAQIPSRELGALLPLSAGEPLDPVRVRNGIMNLYRTGQFDSVEVFAGRVPEGVVIRFVAVPKRWLREVIFEGNLYIGDTDLLKNIDLSRREEITEKRLAQNAQRLEKYYAFRGFTGTVVSYRVEPAGGNQTQVIFRIREGVSGFISDMRVEGDGDRSRFRTARLIASMPGEDLDGKTIARDTEKIRRKLREMGHLSARVNHRLDPDPGYPKGTILTFLIEKGPRFNLQVRGRDSAD